MVPGLRRDDHWKVVAEGARGIDRRLYGGCGCPFFSIGKRQRRVFITAWGNAPGQCPRNEIGLKARPIQCHDSESPPQIKHKLALPMARAVGACQNLNPGSSSTDRHAYDAGRFACPCALIIRARGVVDGVFEHAWNRTVVLSLPRESPGQAKPPASPRSHAQTVAGASQTDVFGVALKKTRWC